MAQFFFKKTTFVKVVVLAASSVIVKKLTKIIAFDLRTFRLEAKL